MEQKKSKEANLELRRRRVFLMSLIFVMSLLYVALSWNASLGDNSEVVDLEDIIDDIDFSKLKKNQDMVAAITETDNPSDANNVKPSDVVVKQNTEPSASKLLVGDGEGEIKEATVEEVKPQVLDNDSSEPEGFKAIEELPEFPGGSSAFMKWINTNIKYPRNSMVKGKVVVSFIIDKEGNVQNLKIEKAESQTLAQLVMTQMRKMPQWKPGKSGGKPCKAMIAVPINFEH